MTILAALKTWMDDPSITDICMNADGRAFVDRGNGLELTAIDASTSGQAPLKAWVLEQLSAAGKSWDARNPFVDSVIPPSHRLHAVFPPVGGLNGMLLSLRRLGKTLVEAPEVRWSSSRVAYAHLCRAASAGESIVIAGSTGSGKTTLLNDLISTIPKTERLIALEDTPELAPTHPHFVTMQSRPPNADGFGEVSIRTLLKQCLRMRPDRILLGECRGAEVLDLLQVLNTGHRGSLATIHANSARDALKRLEILAMLAAGEALPMTVLREWIAAGIQWVVHVERGSDGIRRIRELTRVEGLEAGVIVMRRVDVGATCVV